MAQVTESTQNLVTLKIKQKDREWLIDEQQRLRKVEKREPSHHEIFSRMRRRYQDEVDAAAGRPVHEVVESPLQEALRKLIEKEPRDLTDVEVMYRNVLDDYLAWATMPAWERQQRIDDRRRRLEKEGK